MPAPAALSLDTVSVLLVWTAIAIYALAFIAYAMDLARRSALALDAQDQAQDAVASRAREFAVVGADAGARSAVASSGGLGGPPDRPSGKPALSVRSPQRWARIGTSLTVLGLLFHIAGDVTRGISAGRVPWSNMYEFALTGTMLIVAVYLLSLFRYDLRFLG